MEGLSIMEQQFLFENPRAWVDVWQGMPEFNQEDQTPWQSIKVHFACRDDRKAFEKAIGQSTTDKTQSVWYPEAEIGHYTDRQYNSGSKYPTLYPIYVISKGRWESRLTSRALEAIGVPYHIVVEPQEYDAYASVVDAEKILTLPFSNLGQGSIPARNWVWEHSIEAGSARHWILDDNLKGFYRLHHNLKVPVADGATFRAAEDFVDRYENVAISGFNYFMFASRKSVVPPFVTNTRIYSCILIQNNIPYRWRGRYNEDTDLSLRALKDSWCTVLFNAFLAWKMTTMTMNGGNTEDLYEIEDGRLKMAESLQEQHPDVATVTRKWGRWQHQVDYRPFKKNKLKLRDGVIIPEGVNNYGMELRMLDKPTPTVTQTELFQKAKEQ